jgi:hypothetical protein
MNHPFLVPVLFSLVACTATDDSDVELVEESVDSAISGQSEAAIVATLADGATATTTAAAAAKIAANANLQPAGCATVTTSGATTTVAIAGCSGARGLVNVTGTIAVTITAATASSVSLTATSSDLQINGASLDLAVDATYTASGASSSLAVTSSSSGVGARGHAIVHTGDYTATWDANCATVDGSWATANETARRSLDVSVSRCRTTCPIGAVTRTRLDGSTIAITFDGTSTASWSSSRRGAGTVSLDCTP